MKVSILGCGRWGSFMAWYFDSLGYNVLLWGRESSINLKRLIETGKNDYVSLTKNIIFTTSLEDAISFCDNIFISINEQKLRDLLSNVLSIEFFDKKHYILCMKGIETNSCKRLSQVARECLGVQTKIAVMLGPGHPSDLIAGIPTCMIIDSDDNEFTKTLVHKFSDDLIKITAGNDLIGNEIGAALKNVIGIGGGLLDGLGVSSMKGLLMVAGINEVAKLIKRMGGNCLTAFGLACLGEFHASVYSTSSNSRTFGVALAKGDVFDKHAPGIMTSAAVHNLIEKYQITLPLCNGIYDIIFRKVDPKSIISILISSYKYDDIIEKGDK